MHAQSAISAPIFRGNSCQNHTGRSRFRLFLLIKKNEAASLPLRLLVLTFHTDNLCYGFTLLASPDYHSGQLTTVDTAGVEAFAVFENIFAALGVMAVDNGRALFLEKFGLFVVP